MNRKKARNLLIDLQLAGDSEAQIVDPELNDAEDGNFGADKDEDTEVKKRYEREHLEEYTTRHNGLILY